MSGLRSRSPALGTSPRRVHRLGLLMLAAVAIGPAGLSSPRSARADAFDEREQQLKALGIDDDLRPRIHRAIGVGSHWLAETLASDPILAPKSKKPAIYGAGPGILATLALAHSKTSESVPAARAAARRLLVEDKTTAGVIRTQTYMAGIAGLIAADPDCEVPAEVAKELALNLAAGQEPSTGWWGYLLASVGGMATSRGLTPEIRGIVNLSTTQFAVLGAFGLRRAGVPVPNEVWERHARGLCDAQAEDGSWSYNPRKAPNGYPNGTYMGIAGLVVAEDALRDRLKDVSLLRAMAAARVRGLQALRRDVGTFVTSTKSILGSKVRGKFARVPGVSFVDGYGMYALEKACIFAGLERVGGDSWYEVGARHLVAAQEPNGSWGDAVNTSFALLFLSRSPERCRPTVVTVTETAPATTKPEKPPPATTDTTK